MWDGGRLLFSAQHTPKPSPNTFHCTQLVGKLRYTLMCTFASLQPCTQIHRHTAFMDSFLSLVLRCTSSRHEYRLIPPIVMDTLQIHKWFLQDWKTKVEYPSLHYYSVPTYGPQTSSFPPNTHKHFPSDQVPFAQWQALVS